LERTAEPVTRADVPIGQIDVSAFTVPTDAPEADGTLDWDRTTIIVVHAHGGGKTGVGYTYADVTAASLIKRVLARCAAGRDAMDVEAVYAAMRRAVRNLGQQGLSATAISAVDIALWDLKARVLDVAMVGLLGAARDAVAIYGSGGFTSYTTARLEEQLAGWADAGIRAVKMKIGRDAAADRSRVRAARAAIGSGPELFVDANGAYDRKVALSQAVAFQDQRVTWFEEPVSADDLDGLRLLRDRGPAGMEIAAGEYGYDTQYFQRMAAAGAVDVLQADATRCGGITGFLRAAAICDAWMLPMSAHTAPGVHAHAGCAASRLRNVEYFHDHVRIERLLFDGTLEPVDGALRPDRTRAGLGIELKRRDAERFAI
jgi:L-alanine-DL-glutamate epimerase-like enolase superfamily enzyme